MIAVNNLLMPKATMADHYLLFPFLLISNRCVRRFTLPLQYRVLPCRTLLGYISTLISTLYINAKTFCWFLCRRQLFIEQTVRCAGFAITDLFSGFYIRIAIFADQNFSVNIVDLQSQIYRSCLRTWPPLLSFPLA